MLYNNHCVHASSWMQAGLLSLPNCACRPTVISQLLSCLCVQRLPPVRSLCQNRVPPPLTLPSPLYSEWLKVTLWRNPECIAAFDALSWGVFFTHNHKFLFCTFIFKLALQTAKYAACVLANTNKTCGKVLKILPLEAFFRKVWGEGGVVLRDGHMIAKVPQSFVPGWAKPSNSDPAHAHLILLSASSSQAW